MFLYRGLTIDQDPRCPDGKRATLALSPTALLATVLREARNGDPVRALARWRCAHGYHEDAQLPTQSAHSVARAVKDLASTADREGKRELALRHYALCAIVGLQDRSLSVDCRRHAERRRLQLLVSPKRRKARG